MNDHAPPHSHVFKDEGQAKILLDGQVVESSEGLSPKEVKQAVAQVRAHLSDFADAWERIHG